MKLSNKQLLLLFAALIIIVFGVRLISQKKAKGNLKSSFFELDSSLITRFNITPLSDDKMALIVFKENNKWFIQTTDDQKYEVSSDAINYALTEIMKMKPSRLATESKENWAKYEVDSSGTLLEINTGDETVEIIIGKMTFQNSYLVNTYVRLPEEEAVYASECYLERAFKSPLNQWRKKQVFLTPSGMWKQISFLKEGNSIELNMQENKWFYNGVPIADTIQEKLINSLTKLNNLSFSQESISSQAALEIQIKEEGDELTMISIFPKGSGAVLTSSSNSGNWFNIDSVSFAQLNYIVSLIPLAKDNLLIVR
ncbi:DUF4340 domain-containing protein [Bacteroidota bacterium]